MILPYLSELNKKRIILASGSPRRKELLAAIGLNFEVITSDAEEDGDRSDPVKYVMENALKKGKAVASNSKNYDYIIAADTVVFHDNKILEKPKSVENAKNILNTISGELHQVVTGVALLTKTNEHVFSEKTDVFLDQLSDEFINAYIKTGEPMDKAGAYGIQNIGASFIKKINGCYYNVMGFPVNKFVQKIISLNKF